MWERFHGDGRLPGLDGMSLAGRIRKESGTPIVLISDRDDPAHVVTCLDAGADGCSAKPFEGSILSVHMCAASTKALPPVGRRGLWPGSTHLGLDGRRCAEKPFLDRCVTPAPSALPTITPHCEMSVVAFRARCDEGPARR
nr:response regulator [Streptomyces antibioticus]